MNKMKRKCQVCGRESEMPFHTCNRSSGSARCEDCGGRGSLWKTWDTNVPEPICLTCDGTGRIKRAKPPNSEISERGPLTQLKP